MRILIVEDDERSVGWLCELLAEEFPSLEHQVIATESQFLAELPSIAQNPPDLAIVDVMLRWADLSEGPLPPAENLTHGPFRAGFRIVNMLTEKTETRGIPIVIHSSISSESVAREMQDLPHNVVYVRKVGIPDELLGVVRSFLATSPRAKSLFQDRTAAPIKRAKTKIFVSYSHRDRHWLEELQITLRPYLRDEEFMLWDDNQIVPGSKWKADIEQSLRSADVAILLVSRYFFASDFIARNELPPLLDAAKRNGVKILWIAVSWSSYERSSIADFQALNHPTEPLDSLTPAELNRQLVDIAKKIHQATSPTAGP